MCCGLQNAEFNLVGAYLQKDIDLLTAAANEASRPLCSPAKCNALSMTYSARGICLSLIQQRFCAFVNERVSQQTVVAAILKCRLH